MFVGDPTRMEVAGMGGNVIVELVKKWNSTTWARHVVPYQDGGGWPC